MEFERKPFGILLMMILQFGLMAATIELHCSKGDSVKVCPLPQLRTIVLDDTHAIDVLVEKIKFCLLCTIASMTGPAGLWLAPCPMRADQTQLGNCL